MSISKLGQTGGSFGAVNYPLKNREAKILGGLFFGNRAELLAQFNAWNRKRPGLKNNTCHLIESYAPGEAVSDRIILARTKEKLKRLGFEKCPFVVVRHTDKEHYLHAHIIVSRIKPDGSVVDDSNLIWKAIDATKELDAEFGMHETPFSEQAERISRNEYEMKKRTGEPSEKDKLRERVRAAKKESDGMPQFLETLNEMEIGFYLRFNEDFTSVRGIVFDSEKFVCSGSKLSKRELSFPALAKALNYDENRDLLAVVAAHLENSNGSVATQFVYEKLTLKAALQQSTETIGTQPSIVTAASGLSAGLEPDAADDEGSGANGRCDRETEQFDETPTRNLELPIDWENAAVPRDQPLAEFWWKVIVRDTGSDGIYLNPAAREIVRRSFAQSSTGIESAVLDLDAAVEAKTITVVVEKLRVFAGAKPDYATAIEKVAEAVEKSLQSTNGATFFTSKRTENNVASLAGLEKDSRIVEPGESHFETNQQAFAKLAEAVSKVNLDEQSNRLTEAEKLEQMAFLFKEAADKKLSFTLPNGNEIRAVEETDWQGVRFENPKTKPLIYAFVETKEEMNSGNSITAKASTGSQEMPGEVVRRVGISASGDNVSRVVKGNSDGIHGYVPGDLADVLSYVKDITSAAEENARIDALKARIESDNRARQIKADKLIEIRGKLSIEAAATQTIPDPPPLAGKLSPRDSLAAKAVVKTSDRESSPVASELPDFQDLSTLMAEEIRLRHRFRDIGYQFTEWEKDRKTLRVEITRAGGGEASSVSIADLDLEARNAAREKTNKTDQSGVLRLKAYEENRTYDQMRSEVYKANLKTAKDGQSSEREQIDRILTETANVKQLEIAAREAKWIKIAERCETLQSSIGEEAAKFIEPKFAPEEIWRLQEKAGFRGDEEGFFELEAVHREKQLPRSQEALARLQGIRSVAEVNARVERESYKKWSEKHSDEETVTVRVRSENGKIRVLEINQKEADAEQKDAGAQSKSFAESAKASNAQAFKSLAQPLSNKLNPFSPIQGTLSWLTDPAATLNNHLNPLQVIKNDPGVQVIRAVADFVKYADKSFKQDALSKAASQTAEEYAQIIKPQLSEKLAEVGRVRLESAEKTEKFSETVKNALDFEARIRTDLSVESEIAAENLEIPHEAIRLTDLKKMGDQAIQLRDKTMLEEYTEGLSDERLARSLGETEARVLTRSVKADIKLAAEARSIIETVERTGENEIEIQMKLSNVSRFEQASEVAKIASDALYDITPETLPSFTAKEEFALRSNINHLDTRTAINLNRILEKPENAIESIENLTRVMTAEAAPQTIPFEKMTPQLQELYREGLEINRGLQQMTNALETQSVLDAQAQMAFHQRLQDAANGLETLVSPPPPAYTLSHPIMEMKMEERDTLARQAREIENGEIKNAMTLEDMKSSAEYEREEEVEEIEDTAEIDALFGGQSLT